MALLNISTSFALAFGFEWYSTVSGIVVHGREQDRTRQNESGYHQFVVAVKDRAIALDEFLLIVQ
jgi:hypothetical protein